MGARLGLLSLRSALNRFLARPPEMPMTRQRTFPGSAAGARAPAGLKVVKYDQYLRAVFDKVPPPPPRHFPGADKVTVLEDTDGDGTFDKAKDVITGLNIVSSLAIGRGGIWVLNPPYLLFYRDA